MKKLMFFGLMSLAVWMASCSQASECSYGTLRIRYGNPYSTVTWNGSKLLLYSVENPEIVLEEISSKNLKTVKINLLPGTYCLKTDAEEEDNTEMVFQILPDRTTKVYFYKTILVMDDPNYAMHSGLPTGFLLPACSPRDV